jgi:cyclase
MRLIARLDVKNDHVIKGVHLEGLRKVGDPVELALAYYQAGIHEIVFMDAVASLYERNNLFSVISEATRQVFVPIALGGGLRSLDDVSRALDAGADKVVINTGAVRNIRLVTDIANRYGAQCVVGSIEAQRAGAQGSGASWSVFINNGREPTDLDAVSWARQLQEAGCGEILVTSIDMEGTRRGFDIGLAVAVQAATTRPVIVSGGYGSPAHFDALFRRVIPSGVAVAGALHYKTSTVQDLNAAMAAALSGIGQ